MKRNRILIYSIVIAALLLVSAVTYDIVRDDDPYKYFTGIGSELSISQNDEDIIFPYYTDGNEAIYKANIDGSQVEKVADSAGKQLHDPKYASDEEQIIYLVKNAERTNGLFIIDRDGGKQKQLTEDNLHVSEAVYSPADNRIYYIGIAAAEFLKDPGEEESGYDLYSVKPDGGDEKQLTDEDHISLSNLFVPADGELVYFSTFSSGTETYAIVDKEVNPAILADLSNDEMSHQAWSPDEKELAYTAVSKESRDSSLFKYDLFIKDTESGEIERLTDLKAATDSPVFFHNQKKIVFLENTTWPNEPSEYILRTVDLEDKQLATIDLTAPESEGGQVLQKTLDRAVNGYTEGALYIVLFALLTVFVHKNNKKIYRPAIVSFGIALAIFLIGIVAALTGNPWVGIGVGMLAAAVFVCSLLVLLFAFIWKRIAKRT